MPSSLVEQAAASLTAATRVVCLTGAGVSAESGVPTFRDAQTGLWSRYDPEELASPGGFARNPGLVWRWYMWRLSLVEKAAPNPGHRALAELGGQLSGFQIVTQNVDDLHERAGSTEVLHLHGSLFRFLCTDCRAPYELHDRDREAEEPPSCPQCGAYIRPGVVWFGEALPWRAVEAAVTAAAACDVMLVVGTSGLVYPAAQLPWIAQQAGALLIDVNPSPGAISSGADIFLQGKGGELLPQLVQAVTRRLVSGGGPTPADCE